MSSNPNRRAFDCQTSGVDRAWPVAASCRMEIADPVKVCVLQFESKKRPCCGVSQMRRRGGIAVPGFDEFLYIYEQATCNLVRGRIYLKTYLALTGLSVICSDQCGARFFRIFLVFWQRPSGLVQKIPRHSSFTALSRPLQEGWRVLTSARYGEVPKVFAVRFCCS